MNLKHAVNNDLVHCILNRDSCYKLCKLFSRYMMNTLTLITLANPKKWRNGLVDNT